MASLNAFAARKRTTVLALILMASPVCGLRPMRALRCALTARPRLGITNLPALPLHSFTASLKSSSKNCPAPFLVVPHFSAMYATILDLLMGFAIFVLDLLLSLDWCEPPRSFPLGHRAAHGRHYKDSSR